MTDQELAERLDAIEQKIRLIERAVDTLFLRFGHLPEWQGPRPHTLTAGEDQCEVVNDRVMVKSSARS
jgi:hypothetical protein